MKKNEILKYLIFAIVGILIVYFIQKGFSFEDFSKSIQEAKIQYVVLSTLVGLLAVFIRALRWQLLLKPLGYDSKLSNAYHATMSGYLVNLGIPRSGEVSRCLMLSKSDNIPTNVLIGTVLSERVLDLIMLALVIFLSVITQFDLLYGFVYDSVLVKLKDNLFFAIIGILILLAGLYIAFNARKFFKPETKIGKALIGFFDGIKSVFKVEKPVLFIVYTLGIWFCYWMMTWTILLAFNFSEGLGMAGGLSTLVFSSLGVIIPAPAGSAAAFSISLGLSTIYSMTDFQAKTIGIVMFFANIIMIIVAGAISYVIMARRTKA